MISRQNIKKNGVGHGILHGRECLFDLIGNRVERGIRKNGFRLFFYSEVYLRLIPRITRGRRCDQISGKRCAVSERRLEGERSLRAKHEFSRPRKRDHAEMHALGKRGGFAERHDLAVNGNRAEILAVHDLDFRILRRSDAGHRTGHAVIGRTKLHGISLGGIGEHECGNGCRHFHVSHLRLDLALMERIVGLMQKLVPDDLDECPVAVIKINIGEAMRQLSCGNDLFPAAADIMVHGPREGFFLFIDPRAVCHAERFFIRLNFQCEATACRLARVDVHDGNHVFSFF